ncbi:hypothetical protein PENTCL1PPCAC_11041, partial [Pristionchus entomophagus]
DRRNSWASMVNSQENLVSSNPKMDQGVPSMQQHGSYPVPSEPQFIPVTGRSSKPPSMAPPPPPITRPGQGYPRRKRNRLQEWKTCCCRPCPIIICILLTLLIIAAIIAIAVTQSQARVEEQYTNNGQPVQQQSYGGTNMAQLPLSLQQRLQGQQGQSSQPYGVQPGQQQQGSQSYGVQSGQQQQAAQPYSVQQPYGAPSGQQQGAQQNGMTASNYNSQSQNGQYGNGISNGQQQPYGNTLQNGQSSLGYGNNGMSASTNQQYGQGTQQQNNQNQQNGIYSNLQFPQIGQQQTQQKRTGDNTGYSPNLASSSNGGYPNMGSNMGQIQMNGMNGNSPSDQSSRPSSGYIADVSQSQPYINQPQPRLGNEFFVNGRR